MRFALLGLLVVIPLISAEELHPWDSDGWVGETAPQCMKDCAVQVGTELLESWKDEDKDKRICGDFLDENSDDTESSRECTCKDEGFNKKWGQCIYAKCSETEVEVVLGGWKADCGMNGMVYNEEAFKDGKDSGVGRSCASLGFVSVAAAGAMLVVL